MRKFISVLVIAVMMLTLAVPAFAAPDSPGPGGDNPGVKPSDNVSEAVPTIGDAIDPTTGAKVEVVVSKPELKDGETLQSVTEGAMQAAEDAGVNVSEANAAEVFNIDMSDGTQPDGSVKVTFVREKDSGTIAAIMYQAEDGTWDSAEFTQNPDGTVVVTFKHFCTVVLLVNDPTVAPDVKPTPKPDGGSTGGSGSSEPTSPQTGYDCA